jgi:ribose 5-phosphate isomerase B
MQIHIGSDHAGYSLKEVVIAHLKKREIEVIDHGTHSEERADYPDFGHAVARGVNEKEAMGIVICGSGNGINMSVNKHAGIRSALCWREDIAALARQHNNANVLALPARFISEEEALSCVDAFLNNDFEGGRHAARVDKIDA